MKFALSSLYPGSDKCPRGWTKASTGPSCFWATTNKKSYTDAVSDCQIRGGSLASAADPSQQRLLTEYLQRVNLTSQTPLWIGLEKSSSFGRYKWADTSPALYRNWQCDQKTFRASCVFALAGANDKTGKWGTGRCWKNYGYVCQLTTDKPQCEYEVTWYYFKRGSPTSGF